MVIGPAGHSAPLHGELHITKKQDRIMVKYLCIALLLCLFMIHAPETVQGRDEGGFAVVELFTSEGCSSCPPADRLLTKIIEKANPNQRIYCLSFHVDYWNYIGWNDPYSDKSFSERQRKYSRAFRSSRIYTPQMIVNGTTEFVGSDRSRAEKAIEAGLGKNNTESLSISKPVVADGRLTVTFDFAGQSRPYLLNIALVERDLAQQVTRGENSGRKLTHDNVVRQLETREIKSSGNGKLSLPIPSIVNLDKCAVIAYVQNQDDMQVVAATASDL